jgi:hypothetical protein
MSVRPNREGFITSWLISGPKLSDFSPDKSFDDQLAYEKYMRSILRDDTMKSPPQDIAVGAESPLGMPWRYCGCWFVDVSTFYSIPARVELYACAELSTPEAMSVTADLWTYAAVDMWLDDEHVCTVQNPVYKPITRRQLTLSLKAGANRVFIRMQNLGVRDTRSVLGLQLRGPAAVRQTS